MVYTDIEGYFDYADMYDKAVDESPSGSVLVEVGVYLGRSIVYLANKVRESGKQIKIVGVDNFKYSSRAQLEYNLQACGVDDLVRLVESDSDIAAGQFADKSLAFVFIDADHSYEAVKKDVMAWRGKVEPGGILAGHDRVRECVDKALRETLGEFNTIGPLAWWVRL